MRRLETRTLSKRIREVTDKEARPITKQVFLAQPYTGYARQVSILIGDPSNGRGALAVASFAPGLVTGEIPQFTPVTVTCRHGRFEITGLRTS